MLKILLFPLSIIYRIIVGIRNFLYESNILKQREFEVPIVSIGNITAGGTGKTPLSEYIIDMLQNQFNIAYLSRGYKRKTKGFVLADEKSNTEKIGDESVQIKQKFPQVPVAVCEDRVKGIETLLADNNLDMIVLDDAFQHRSVKANINILLIDYTRPIHEDFMLPYGMLREPVSAHYRANVIIFTKCPTTLTPIDQRVIKKNMQIKPYQSLFFTTIEYGEITPMVRGSQLFCDDLRNYKVLLFTGISNPNPLVDYLKGQVGEIVQHVIFSDHHNFSNAEIVELFRKFENIESKNKLIITTEKDISRIKFMPDLPETFIDNLFFIPIKVKFLDDSKDQFNKKIQNYVIENKSNSKLHKR